MGFNEAGVAMEVSATSSQTSFHSEWTQMQVAPPFSVHQSTRKGKEGKEADLYSAYRQYLDH